MNPSLVTHDTSLNTRKAIDAEIHHLEQSLRSLRTRRNDLAPINKLPPEILIEIFMSMAALPPSPEHPWRSRITQVCSHWREIALACSNLWAHIDFQSPGWELYLSRTNAVPLTLDLQGSRAFDLFHRTFVKHAHRVRECRLVLSPSYFDRFFAQLGITRFPMLETLDLTGDDGDEDELPLFDSHVPSLRCLRLKNIGVLWNPTCLSGLTHLSVSSDEDPELSQVLAVLEHTIALQVLELSGIVPECPTNDRNTNSTSSSCRIVRLANLALLRLRNVLLSTCAHFVTHLDLPESVQIILAGRVFPPLLQLCRAVDSLAPHSSTGTNRYKLDVDLTLGIQITIYEFDQPNHHLRHLVIPGIVAVTRISQFLTQAFGKFVQLTCLDISIGKRSLKCNHWWKALCGMTHVSDLRVRKSNKASSLRELLLALGSPKQSSSSPRILLLLPRLRTLHIIGLCTHAGAESSSARSRQTISKLLEPVMKMRSSSAARIQHLKITSCDLGFRGDLSSVRKLVDVLEYGEETCDDCRRATEERELDDDESSSDDEGSSSDNTDSSSDDTDSSSEDAQLLRRYIPFRGF